MNATIGNWKKPTKYGERFETLRIIPYLNLDGVWSGYCWITDSECCGPFRDDEDAERHGIAWLENNGYTKATA